MKIDSQLSAIETLLRSLPGKSTIERFFALVSIKTMYVEIIEQMEKRGAKGVAHDNGYAGEILAEFDHYLEQLSRTHDNRRTDRHDLAQAIDCLDRLRSPACLNLPKN